ncbi:hypothetical protein [Paenibacillus medicaginis]|uniref:Rubredoxin n=1 Tax=Paenibacillus medicaginis TaxID=1470560 RepID=A0ABV5C183_9BACL
MDETLDKGKQLDWIANEMEHVRLRDGNSDAYIAGRLAGLNSVRHAVESGSFTPDSPDTPQRKFKCGECGEINSAEKWNEETIKGFDTTNIFPIESKEEGADFVCPKCGAYQDNFSIEELIQNEGEQP